MNIIEEVRGLDLPFGKYVVFGSGILSAKGIRPSKDIDLLINEDLFKILKSKGWKRKYFFRRVLTCRLLINGKFEAFSNAYRGSYRKSVVEIIRTAEVIQGIPFMNLSELKSFKQAMGRPKDLADVSLIDKYFRTHPS